MPKIQIRFLLILTFLALLGSACSASTPHPKYERQKQWGSWKTHKCINTRNAILKKRAITPVVMTEDGCRVKEGKWVDFYTGETISMKDQPEIDHVVPIKKAHDLGGHQWPKSLRHKFYNDHDNLVITVKSLNSAKRNKDLVVWYPATHERACLYAAQWIYVKNKYDLKYSQEECSHFKVLEEKRPCPKPLAKVKGC